MGVEKGRKKERKDKNDKKINRKKKDITTLLSHLTHTTHTINNDTTHRCTSRSNKTEWKTATTEARSPSDIVSFAISAAQ